MSINYLGVIKQVQPKGHILSVIDGASNYMISNFGEVISIVKKTPKILKGIDLGQQKYKGVQIKYDDGIVRKKYIHHLVAEHWLLKKENDVQIRHLNGNNQDNRLENLRYGTSKENNQDKIIHRTILDGEKNPMSKLTEKEVLLMRTIKNKSYKKIGEMFNVSPMTAYRAIKKEAWKNV